MLQWWLKLNKLEVNKWILDKSSASPLIIRPPWALRSRNIKIIKETGSQSLLPNSANYDRFRSESVSSDTECARLHEPATQNKLTCITANKIPTNGSSWVEASVTLVWIAALRLDIFRNEDHIDRTSRFCAMAAMFVVYAETIPSFRAESTRETFSSVLMSFSFIPSPSSSLHFHIRGSSTAVLQKYVTDTAEICKITDSWEMVWEID